MKLTLWKLFFFLGCLFFPSYLYAWGGLEHSAITAAALEVLPAVFLTWLGAGFYKLIKIHCNYPDFNWARYGEIICTDKGFARLPDKRRDWDAKVDGFVQTIFFFFIDVLFDRQERRFIYSSPLKAIEQKHQYSNQDS